MNFAREHRRQGDRLRTPERVADDDVRARLACRLQQRVKVGGFVAKVCVAGGASLAPLPKRS